MWDGDDSRQRGSSSMDRSVKITQKQSVSVYNLQVTVRCRLRLAKIILQNRELRLSLLRVLSEMGTAAGIVRVYFDNRQEDRTTKQMQEVKSQFPGREQEFCHFTFIRIRGSPEEYVFRGDRYCFHIVNFMLTWDISTITRDFKMSTTSPLYVLYKLGSPSASWNIHKVSG
ncbi:hypothetical protein llap_6380 [Limosa lapponica baueri]|uniref:Uncharacterized protein n=1 Tax=Limosa lapponica baueri TaxID=1758121 RepID=A0A2I0UBA3_LIMLA|nr:hypothetical protein llap_6380 [Limosa lapponica baueri]